VGGAAPNIHCATGGQERHQRVDHADIDPASDSGPCTLVKRRQDGPGAEQTRSQIADRFAHLHRRARRVTRQRHQARQRLRHEVEGRQVVFWTRLAETGNACVDQTLIPAGELGVSDAEACSHARPEILDQYVGGQREASRKGLPGRLLQINGHAELVAIDQLEQRALAPAKRADVPVLVALR